MTIARSTILPVFDSPGFEAECYHNFRLSILLAHSNYTSWKHSHYINLTIHAAHANRFPMITFEDHLHVYADVLKETPLLGGNEGWVASIRDALDEGHYVLPYVNWNEVPSFNRFGESDLVHECLIYGYNDDEKYFMLLAFEVEGKMYGRTRLSYAECERLLRSLHDEGLHRHKWFAFHGFPVARIELKMVDIPDFDPRYVYFALDRGNINAIGIDESYVVGPYVSAYLAECFKRYAVEGRYPEDWAILWHIGLHKLILHNRLAKERFSYLACHTQSPSITRINGLLDSAERTLLNIRMLTSKHRKTGDEALIFTMSEQLRKLYEIGKRALPLMKEYFVHRQLNIS